RGVPVGDGEGGNAGALPRRAGLQEILGARRRAPRAGAGKDRQGRGEVGNRGQTRFYLSLFFFERASFSSSARGRRYCSSTPTRRSNGSQSATTWSKSRTARISRSSGGSPCIHIAHAASMAPSMQCALLVRRTARTGRQVSPPTSKFCLKP